MKMNLPEHLPKLLELVVGDLSSNCFEPLRHETLPQRLADDIIRYQT